MRNGLAARGVGWFTLALATGCAAPGPAPQTGPECAFGDVAFSASFPGGRLDGCRRTGRRAFLLAIEPEARPINPSPWYAFDVLSEAPQALEITLDYGDFRHRYVPKLGSGDGSGWTRLDAPVVTRHGGTQASFTLVVPAGVRRVAAQPIVTPGDTRAWVEDVARRTPLEAGVLGSSAEGRTIPRLAGGNARGGTLVITGRQHPPEVTGAFALRAFVERLAEDEPLAAQFREHYGVLVVPMLNPDGVARGHWRLDSAGTDLNRDWGPFRRPETRLVRDALTALAPVLILDFHSTKRDVLYTPPDDAAIERAGFPPAWHAAINARLDGEPIARDANHNPRHPTLKSWVPDALGVPAITFEVGDATPRDRIDTMARIAAEEAMRLLLEHRVPLAVHARERFSAWRAASR